MREIKFRFYSKKKNRMVTWEDVKNQKFVTVGALEDNTDSNNHSPWMQYTGLKDKNGTEIYEGDLIQFSDWNPKEVIYEGGDGLAGFRLKGTDLFMMGFESNEYEVVGNVYEDGESI